jgi:hypothetical protein
MSSIPAEHSQMDSAPDSTATAFLEDDYPVIDPWGISPNKRGFLSCGEDEDSDSEVEIIEENLAEQKDDKDEHSLEESEIEGNNKSKIGEPTLTSFYFHISETGNESPPKLKICLPARPKPQGSRVMGEGTIPTKYGKRKYNNETSGDSDSSEALESPPKPKLHVHRMKSKKADGNQNSRRPSKVTEEPPRKRGRPRKVIIARDDDLPVVVPKKRGRPAKTVEDPKRVISPSQCTLKSHSRLC